MKKFVLLSIMAVAAIMTFSCAKQGLDTTTKGKMVTLTVTAPDLDEEPGSKVSFNGASHTAFVWDGNESLHLFSYTKATSGASTDWGNFTTTTSGTTASFTGTVPGEKWGTSVVAAIGRNLQMNFISSKWRIYYNIPNEQDGTGFKYCAFVGMPEYDDMSNTFTFAVSDNADGDVIKGPFKLRNALSYFIVPDYEEGKKVVEIKITCTTDGSTAENIVCYNSGARAVGFNLEIPGNGTYKTANSNCTNVLTISNSGNALEGEIRFASLMIGTGKHLKFELKNQENKIAKGSVTLTKAVNNAWVSKFGELPFKASDFKYASYD